MDKRVTVLGAGSSGMATAAYLTLTGWEVTLWDTPEQAGDFEAIRRQGGILLRGGSGITGCAMPRLTTHLAEALADVRRVIVSTSAARHRALAEQIAPLAQPGQVFLLHPGNFGSFFFRRELDARGRGDVPAAELCGCLWACRRTAPGETLVATPLKERLKAAALPAADTGRVVEAFRGVLPLEAGTNVLEVSLNSPNVISHVAGAVLNAGGIERKGAAFAFFLDGLGENAIRCFRALEEERNAVMARLGLTVYSPSSEGFMRVLMDRGSHPELDLFRSLDGPSGFSHRYVSEDAACGAAMLVSLGRQYRVPMPVTGAFLTIAGLLGGRDYAAQGRTLENLGLAGRTEAQLLAALAEGPGR